MRKRPCLGLLMLCALAICQHPPKAWSIPPLTTHLGVGTFLHPIPEPPCLDGAGHSPDGRRVSADHVHIIAVNGVDPLCVANFNGLCEHLKARGFANTCFAQLYSCDDLARKIRTIRACDPSARFVLIGFSMGCNRVRCLANRLGQDGIPVELLVYIAGDSIFANSRSCPCNASRVLNITAHGCAFTGGDLFMNGSDLPCARNVRLRARHFQTPSRRETVELLMEELLAVACSPSPAAAPASLPEGKKSIPDSK